MIVFFMWRKAYDRESTDTLDIEWWLPREYVRASAARYEMDCINHYLNFDAGFTKFVDKREPRAFELCRAP